MADALKLETAISRIISIGSTVPEAEQEKAMAACMSEALGVESVSIQGEVQQGSNRLSTMSSTQRSPTSTTS